VVVSRKVHKSAVVRNRIRRRIYEIVRQSDARLTDHRDLVFTVFSERIAEMPAADLAPAVKRLLTKAAEAPDRGPHAIVNKRRVKEEEPRVEQGEFRIKEK